MKAVTLSLFMALGTVAPALAADQDALDKVVDGSLIVTRLGGLGAGLVIGCPIAAVRETASTYRSWTDTAADKVGGKMGGKDSGPACALVSLVTLPAAMVVGGAKGIYYGTKNSFTHGFNEPFTQDSFSLGKLEE